MKSWSPVFAEHVARQALKDREAEEWRRARERHLEWQRRAYRARNEAVERRRLFPLLAGVAIVLLTLLTIGLLVRPAAGATIDLAATACDEQRRDDCRAYSWRFSAPPGYCDRHEMLDDVIGFLRSYAPPRVAVLAVGSLSCKEVG